MIGNPLNIYLYAQLIMAAIFIFVLIGGSIYIFIQWIKSKH